MSMDKIFFDNYESLTRILISAPVIYIVVIFYIKLIGKRTTSQLNSFDWIVTVAMGSIVSSIIMMKNVPIVNDALAIFTLMGLQYVFTRLMVHFKLWKKVIRSKPELLIFEGKFLEENMLKERIVKAEIYAALREKGSHGILNVYAVVLETDASLSVIDKSELNTPLSLLDVEGVPEHVKEYIKNFEASS